jgi:dipeptidyl aminopeptidase/acylaminoacyl peptidase
MRTPRRLAAAVAIAWAVVITISASTPAPRPGFSLDDIVQTRIPGQFVLSPTRTHVVFTAVGRYFGHPLFPAFGEDANLQWLDLRTGERLQLTTGTASKTYPSVSPDGRIVAFESEGDIWRVDVGTGSARRLTTHVSADRAAAWSPDGRWLAFVSSRWGQSDIYVMSAEGERAALERVTKDNFGEALPTWSPDGRTLVFTSGRDDHFYSRAIYAVAAAGGEVRRLTPPDDARNNLPAFSPDGTRIAYVSDRSGFLNIWTMAADGSDHQQVTRVSQDQDYPENDYIQSMGLRWSPDGRRLLYFTNRDANLDLMTVDVTTRTATPVATVDGSHHPVGWVDDQTVAYVYESYRTPPDLHVRRIGGEPRRVTFSGRAVYRPEHFEHVERASWTSEDGVRVHGFIRRPSNIQGGGRLPALVMSHTYNVGQFYNQWNPILSYIVQSGYVMLTVDHRGSNGYGVAFRDLPRGDWGFAQLKDLVSAAGLLRSRSDVDPDRVGVMGYSMGGYLTLLAATTHPDVFRAAACIFGLGEITGDPQRSSRNYVWHIGGTEAEKPEEYRRASPVNQVARIQAPLFIVHSDGDPIEPVTKVRNFVSALDQRGKTYELALYTNEAHGLRLLEHQRDSYDRLMQFLDRYLRSAP